jgi:O-antigen/teichoic acid export membrane protein
MLGFLADDTAVGLYTAANKMVKVILALVTSLGVVLLPRMSYYIENNEDILVKRLINKSFNFILMISIPATIGIFMLAEAIILLYAGPNYIEAIPTIRIISPIIIAIGLSNLIGIQILTSYGKEKITLVSTLIGAIINFTLNLLLIPSMQQNGAAIGTIVAESSVTIIQLIFAHSYLKGNVKWKTIYSYLLGGALIVLVTSTLKYLIANILLFTFLSVMLSIFAYFGFLYIIKNEMVYEMINKSLVLIKRMFANYFNRRRKNG